MPGYPAELERVAALTDRRLVIIRPILPTDAAALRHALAEADPQTLQARFMGAAPHDEASIRRLVTVDYVYRLALVALTPGGRGVAVARYEGTPGCSSAEVAVAVDPAWRQVGLGILLLHMLSAAATGRGIDRFTALVTAGNTAALALLHASGLDFSVKIRSGTTDVVVPLELLRTSPPIAPERS